MKTSATPSSDYSSDEARWLAVKARDPNSDGHFVYAVRTTGVYCHPSATSRLPKRENVIFFDAPAAAEAAGYRPSKRRKGDRTSAKIERATAIVEACRLIENAPDAPPNLDTLAAHVGLSPAHFHRLFKAETGVTPKTYASAHRLRKLRAALSTGSSITEAVYSAGFNASSRFYESSGERLGMGARAYRLGGVGMVIRFAVAQCTLGALLVAQSQRGICAIALGEDPDHLVRELQDQFPRALLVGDDPHFAEVVALVVGFVEAPAIGLGLPLDVQGTAFQERVWQALREIPPGTTVTYSDLAERIGAPKAVRAVAKACAANRIAIAVPCHRVIRRDGDISGYRWGVERKRELLRRERDA